MRRVFSTVDGRLLLILAVYLALTIAYGLVNPLFEAPDEHNHYFTVQYIADHGRLPVVDPEDEWVGQEAAQPPLYYFLGSRLIGWLDAGEARDQLWPNPRAQLGDAGSPNNINAFVHTGDQAPFLAARLLRLFSTLLGVGTLVFIYLAGRLVWPAQPERALLATGLVAFLPQFNFLHASISNDTLVILLCAAGLWQLLRLWLDGVSAYRLLLLGATIGLAMLSKMAGLLLLFYAIGFLFLLAWREQDKRLAGHTLLLVLLPALLIAGWLLWRNWVLYGDPTAANQFVHYFGGSREYTIWDVLGESSGLWLSFWGVFGWFNVRAPDWVYWLWSGLAALSVMGAISGGRHNPSGRAAVWLRFSPFTVHYALLLAGWFLLVYAGLVRFMLLTPAAQGRLLYPALLPIALGLAYGLSQLRPGRLLWAWPALALVSSLACLTVTIPEAYAPPILADEAAIPERAIFHRAEVGQGLELIAIDLHTEAAHPGDRIEATLYWRQREDAGMAPGPAGAPEFVLELFGRQTTLAGPQLRSYHGNGLYPANLWRPDEIVMDRVALRLDETMAAPAEVWLGLRLVDGPATIRVVALKATPPEWPPLPERTLARLGESIELRQVQLSRAEAGPGEEIRLDATWYATGAVGRDLTTFVHLGELGEPPLAQGDSPPLAGHYPTRYWAAGEVIEDSYRLALPLDLPAGRYPVWIGLYDPHSPTFERLPLFVNGERPAHDAYLAGWVTVSGR